MSEAPPNPKNANDYHTLSKLLHWLIAGLIVLQFVSHELAEYAADSGSRNWEFALVLNHKSVGMTILMLALLRLVWRFVTPPPELPDGMARWQVNASLVSHWLLYGLLLAIPLTGWLMSSAAGVTVAWFKVAYFPDLVAKSDLLAEVFHEIHETLAKVLFVVAIIHVLAAFKHALVDRDGVLGRICSVATVGLGALTIGLGAWWLTLSGASTANAQADTDPDSGAATMAQEAPPSSALPAWVVDADSSHIRFTGSQADTPFTGEWQSFEARIHFDAERLDESLFDVTIDTTSAESGDSDRDATLTDADWFDAAQYPNAYFRADTIVALDNGGFRADGKLIIKDKPSPVKFEFRVQSDGSRRELLGSASLLRLDLGVGTGEWEDTAWVANEVAVDVRVVATLAE